MRCLSNNDFPLMFSVIEIRINYLSFEFDKCKSFFTQVAYDKNGRRMTTCQELLTSSLSLATMSLKDSVQVTYRRLRF